MDHRGKQQELQALDEPNPNAIWEKLFKRRTTSSGPSATQVHYITHNEIHVNNTQEIADAFCECFAPALVSDNNPAT